MNYSSKALLRAILGVSILAVLTGSVFGQTERGKKYALVVGVNEYQHPNLPNLRFAVNDARELHAILKKARYDVVLLSDEAGKADAKFVPTKQNIKEQFDKMMDHGRFNKDDMFLVALI